MTASDVSGFQEGSGSPPTVRTLCASSASTSWGVSMWWWISMDMFIDGRKRMSIGASVR